jgi:hypothetical protein
MGLQQFERRLERLVEGAFAKAFRSELQPVEIGRRLTREMDLRRAVSVRGLIAPNSFEIQLAPPDYDRFEGFLETLERELADAVHEHAQVEQYGFIGPVSVTVGVDEELTAGTFVIISEAVEGEGRPLGWIRTSDGRQIMITDEPVTIGRLPECGIVLADINASRHHAELRPDGDSVVLTDLGSTNGTRVNGTLVHEHRLRSGDRIAIGTTTLVFEAD